LFAAFKIGEHSIKKLAVCGLRLMPAIFATKTSYVEVFKPLYEAIDRVFKEID
jgi:hypothetical protein